MKHWQFDPLVASIVFIVIIIYGIGVVRLWRRAGVGHGVRRWQVSLFVLALLMFIVAVMSPIDWFAEYLFSVHMVQHLLLMLLIPLLVVNSKPTVTLLWGLPPNWRRILGHLQHSAVFEYLQKTMTHPLVVWGLHTTMLWLWHLPSLYQSALQYYWIHILEHMIFLSIGLLYWWSLLHPRNKYDYGVSVLSLFATVIQGALLGALLTFSQHAWYPIYRDTTQQWGLSALQDQQLAGVIMWIPSGVVYISAAAILLLVWFREMQEG